MILEICVVTLILVFDENRFDPGIERSGQVFDKHEKVLMKNDTKFPKIFLILIRWWRLKVGQRY
jgi:hypothetical protein